LDYKGEPPINAEILPRSAQPDTLPVRWQNLILSDGKKFPSLTGGGGVSEITGSETPIPGNTPQMPIKKYEGRK
jgi:hypothetical protein